MRLSPSPASALMRPRTARLAMLTIAATIVLLAGCQRQHEPAASPPAPTAARTPAPIAAADDAPPAGVLRAYVWRCDDGQTLRMRNLFREKAVAIDLHEGTRKLPQVVSASGARYEDDVVIFWTKGSTATFERKGAPAVKCQEVRAQSLLEDARVRGVLYVGAGNEPGWTVEIGPGRALVWVTNYGQERHAYPDAVASGDAVSGLIYEATDAAAAIKVTVRQQPCQDDMAALPFDYQVIVESGGRTYRGCGNRAQR
jgi:membrane-bound inhibitor of C-type lysozyme